MNEPARTPGNALIVFAKTPAPGQVKTRLGRVIGHDTAAQLYSLFIRHLLSRLTGEDTPYDTLIAVAPDADVEAFRARFQGADRYLPQGDAQDLGQRMRAAINTALQAGYTRAVIIGTDSPDLELAWLSDAFSALEQNDIVVGPAEDGGYYLIGAKADHGGLFAEMPWSTDRVLELTLARVKEAGLKIARLPVHFDVDSPETLARLFARVPALREEAASMLGGAQWQQLLACLPGKHTP